MQHGSNAIFHTAIAKGSDTLFSNDASMPRQKK